MAATLAIASRGRAAMEFAATLMCACAIALRSALSCTSSSAGCRSRGASSLWNGRPLSCCGKVPRVCRAQRSSLRSRDENVTLRGTPMPFVGRTDTRRGSSDRWATRTVDVEAAALPTSFGSCGGTNASSRSPQIQLLEEVIALVIDYNKRGKVLDLDPPDRLHAELGVFQHFDLLDAVLGKVRGRPADRGEIEAAEFLASLPHRRRTVALGKHHHRAASVLEIVNEGIHPSRRG